jgi:hypothetical protein
MRSLISFILLATLAVSAWAEPAAPMNGEMIFRQGILPSGKPLRGEREAGINIEGAGAACISCHRRSGLGTAEGQITIPPIIGKYLFRPRAMNIKDMELPHVPGYRSHREPYTDITLARAIREGVDADGRELNYLMPRFKLDDAEMSTLISYLKDLTSNPVPGVTEDMLHFATIITPDADPVKRKAMLDVMEQFFADKNSFIRGGSRPLKSSKEIMYRVTRRWTLHVWELQGAAETWEAQLQQKLKQEPVLAVISGVGGVQWSPVHRFCQQQALPCLFPNVDVPVVAENDFYPIYFSKGVFLEAQLISRQLQKNPEATGVRRVIQVFRQGDIGEEAAKALQTETLPARAEIVNRVLKTSGSAPELAEALHDVESGDTLILWLRPEDLALLPASMVKSQEVYFSGLMGGLEKSPLPSAWRGSSHMTYPFDLPDLRKIRMNFPLTWLKIKHIPVVDERTQSDTYLACGILAEILGEMLDSFVPDYLVERVEVMLSHRVITGYYPRFGLAANQRFASKGGYMVHFAESDGLRLAADGNWIVP